MALPKIELPRYKHFLYGLNKNIEYRTFTVKEQKILLLAKEEKDEEKALEEYVSAIKQIVEVCTFGKVKADTLPLCDLEDLFLRLRAKSVSDKVDVSYRVMDESGKPTEEVVSFSIDLMNDVKVETLEDHDKTIKINDNQGFKMKYPTFDMVLKSKDYGDEGLIIECIDVVYEGDTVETFSDYSYEERLAFVESFDIKILRDVEKFFKTMPRIRYNKEVTLKSGEKKTISYEGLEDFF